MGCFRMILDMISSKFLTSAPTSKQAGLKSNGRVLRLVFRLRVSAGQARAVQTCDDSLPGAAHGTGSHEENWLLISLNTTTQRSGRQCGGQ